MFQRGVGALGDVLFRLGEMWYAGPQYRWLRTKARFHDNPQFTQPINPNDLDTHVGMLGPRFMRDSRSDSNYPRDGSFLISAPGLQEQARVRSSPTRPTTFRTPSS